jgi:LmbE family N-acetylglucosaminyl deacetylase
MSKTAAQIMDKLPFCHPVQLIGDRHVLVIAPHPDDESLGCGGLLAWAAATGRRPRVLFLTDGEASHPGSVDFPPERLGQIRRAEAIDACRSLGIAESDMTFLGLPDSGLGALSGMDRDRAVDVIRRWISQSGPAAVCVTTWTDPHGDHVAAHQLAKNALRGLNHHRFFSYPVWTWLQTGDIASLLTDGWRIDVAEFCKQKQTAVSCHASQHGAVVKDATESFVLPRLLLERMHQNYEILFDDHF